MKKLTKREMLLIIIVGLAVVIFVYGKYFFMPIWDDIKASKQHVEDLKFQIDQLKAMEAANKNLQKKLTELQLKFDEALVKLPILEKNPEIAYYIKPMADESKVTLISADFSADDALKVVTLKNEKNEKGNDDQVASEKKSDDLFGVPVNIEVRGKNYGEIMDFIDLIEKDKRFARVTNVDVTKELETLEGTGTIISQTISVKLKADYYFTSQDLKIKPTYYFNNGAYGKKDLFN